MTDVSGEARDPHGRWTVGEAQAQADAVAAGHKPLAGLPNAPIKFKDGSYYVPGPIGWVKDAANAYMAKAGLPYDPPKTYTPVDAERAKNVAKAFDEMPHDPNNPVVKASYDAMIRETHAQWEALKDAGLQVQWIKPGSPDPYAESPRLAAADVSQNKHIWGFPTESGFGTGEEAKAALKDNPMLRETGETVDGHKMLANDEFRIVHDMFGHLKEGNGFRAGGEENAWRSHASIYSDAARPAMTVGTRGQNSWVNSGPYAEHNKHASAADTHYAPQKIGLMPHWTETDGRSDG